jgi:hypothetical protein
VGILDKMGMTKAYAGEGDFDIKQMQIQEIYREYHPQKASVHVVPVTELTASVEIKEPDWLDNIYVWARVNLQIPSWVIFSIFFIGLMTVIGNRFKKPIKSWLRGMLSD